MNKKGLIFVIVIIAVILGIVTLNSRGSPERDLFAECITESGAKMWGAYWCPHCIEQKKMFGGSWDKIEYVECSLPNNAGQTVQCQLAGITSYPTWEFGDGRRVGGVLSLEQLSEFTGCPVPAE